MIWHPDDARQALAEIVLECVRVQDIGQGLTEEEAVAAGIELIDKGFAQLECVNGCWYRLVPSEGGVRHEPGCRESDY